MQKDYDKIIRDRARHVFDVMANRVSAEDMNRIRAAFELALEAHAPQKRKTGEPYILHPIAVANIAAEEMMLGANPVCAAFLHDVVEDTPYNIEDIRQRFGDDVAFLVKVVTKKPTHDYELSKQLNNYRQTLNSVQYDIRTAFYNDDIQVFTPKGKKIILPQNATVIDFAYEVHTELGDKAKYARINGRLEPMTAKLRRADVIEIFTDEKSHPEEDWETFAHTFKRSIL